MNLPGAGLGVVRRMRDADGRRNQLVQLGDRRLYAGADVEGAGRRDRRIRGAQEGSHDVVDVNVVAGGAAVAVDGGATTRYHRTAEDRDHPCFAMRVLAWPSHVDQCKTDRS